MLLLCPWIKRIAVSPAVPHRTLTVLLVFALAIVTVPARPESPSAAPGQVEALEKVLHTLLAGHADSLSDAGQFLHLANVYLDLGDAYTDENKRRESYEQGAKVAQRALALEPSNAEAHYLYAANVGSAAQLQGMMASALTVNEIKSHVKRALELNPDYAPALHMMGMMYEELPWFLGGDGEAALTHVQHAVTVDPQYTHARLDLARLYLKRRNASAARQELQTIMSGSPRPGTNDQRYRQEARQLLASLPTK